MPSQHRHPPIPFRPPEGDRARLLAYAQQTEQPVNRLLAEALSIYLDGREVPAVNTATRSGTIRRIEMKQCSASHYSLGTLRCVLPEGHEGDHKTEHGHSVYIPKPKD